MTQPETPATPRYEYVLLLTDGRQVGTGPTKNLDSVEEDLRAWSRDDFRGQIMRREVNDWEPLDLNGVHQCGRTIVHGRHDTDEGWCPGLHPTDVRPPDTTAARDAAPQRPLLVQREALDRVLAADAVQKGPYGAGVRDTLQHLGLLDPAAGCACIHHPARLDSPPEVEYEPACPVHSEHVYNPRTGVWDLAVTP